MAGSRAQIARHLALKVLALVAVVGCQGSVALPPDRASPTEVLATYLTAAQAGDCSTARALTTRAGEQQVGSFCGPLRVTWFQILGDASRPGPHEAVFTTRMRFTGGDPALTAREHTIIFELVQQPSGAWRISGGGSSP